MKKRTHIAIVLDTSGSMQSIKSEAIDFFNAQRKAARKSAKEHPDIEHTMTLTLFGLPPEDGDRELGRSGGVKVVHGGIPVDRIEKLTDKTYQPSSMTPMYDGVGRTLAALDALDDGGEQTAFLVVVISDGYENDSREFTAKRIAKKIRKRRKTGRWTFVYLGAEHDLEDVKKAVGLSAGNMVRFDRDTAGVAQVREVLSEASGRYYSSRAMGVRGTDAFLSDEDEILDLSREG